MANLREIDLQVKEVAESHRKALKEAEIDGLRRAWSIAQDIRFGPYQIRTEIENAIEILKGEL